MSARRSTTNTSRMKSSTLATLLQPVPVVIPVPSDHAFPYRELERNGTPPPTKLRQTIMFLDFGACIENPPTPGLYAHWLPIFNIASVLRTRAFLPLGKQRPLGRYCQPSTGSEVRTKWTTRPAYLNLFARASLQSLSPVVIEYAVNGRDKSTLHGVRPLASSPEYAARNVTRRRKAAQSRRARRDCWMFMTGLCNTQGF